jgi:hypothetical protein
VDASLFDSAWLKWGWAVREAKALYDEVYAFAADEDAQGLNTTACQYEPKRHGFSLSVTGMAPLPPAIGLRYGVVAHGFRSALDNLAWALVVRGKRPPHTLTRREKKVVSFPICEERDGDRGFNTAIRGTKKRASVLPGISRRDTAIIRKAQPYTHGKKNLRFHALWMLAELNNADKHRSIQPVFFIPDRFYYEIVDADTRDCEVTRHPRRSRRRIVEVGGELAYFGVRKTGPDPHIHVKYEMPTFPAIHERLGLEQWLRQTILVVSGILNQFSPLSEELLAQIDMPSVEWINQLGHPQKPPGGQTQAARLQRR